jgi:hypothetical protein
MTSLAKGGLSGVVASAEARIHRAIGLEEGLIGCRACVVTQPPLNQRKGEGYEY